MAFERISQGGDVPRRYGIVGIDEQQPGPCAVTDAHIAGVGGAAAIERVDDTKGESMGELLRDEP